MHLKIVIKTSVIAALLISASTIATTSVAAESIALKSEFKSADVARINAQGDASVSGTAQIRLANGEYQGCAGFNVELLPAAAYADERILHTYGNNLRGQILMAQNPPSFTPDVKAYHELLRKTTCDDDNHFSFAEVAAGDYYIIAFIIWDEGDKKHGGGVMQHVHLNPAQNVSVSVGL